MTLVRLRSLTFTGSAGTVVSVSALSATSMHVNQMMVGRLTLLAVLFDESTVIHKVSRNLIIIPFLPAGPHGFG